MFFQFFSCATDRVKKAVGNGAKPIYKESGFLFFRRWRESLTLHKLFNLALGTTQLPVSTEKEVVGFPVLLNFVLCQQLAHKGLNLRHAPCSIDIRFEQRVEQWGRTKEGVLCMEFLEERQRGRHMLWQMREIGDNGAQH